MITVGVGGGGGFPTLFVLILTLTWGKSPLILVFKYHFTPLTMNFIRTTVLEYKNLLLKCNWY